MLSALSEKNLLSSKIFVRQKVFEEGLRIKNINIKFSTASIDSVQELLSYFSLTPTAVLPTCIYLSPLPRHTVDIGEFCQTQVMFEFLFFFTGKVSGRFYSRKASSNC